MFRARIRHNLPRKHAQRECDGVKNMRGGLATMLNEYFRASAKCERALITKLKARESALEFSLHRPWKTVPLWRVLVLQHWTKVQGYKSWSHVRFLFIFFLCSPSLSGLWLAEHINWSIFWSRHYITTSPVAGKRRRSILGVPQHNLEHFSR